MQIIEVKFLLLLEMIANNTYITVFKFCPFQNLYIRKIEGCVFNFFLKFVLIDLCCEFEQNEKVRMELEEHKMRQSRMLVSAIQEAMEKKLKEKDEEIQRMAKLNWALQDRVKTLCVENQIWRELAQTNESTANYLRSNLEQVLAHVGEEQRGCAAAAVADDAQSSCGSNDAAEAGDDTAASTAVVGGRLCRNCGVRESVVLLLPCRHLCLCTMCGSTIRNCPICDSGMDASVHVNLS